MSVFSREAAKIFRKLPFWTQCVLVGAVVGFVYLQQRAPLPDLSVSQESVVLGQEASPFYRVVRVVDGDTIQVEISGERKTVRVVGINTPETVDPRKPVECFGKEASDFAKQLLSGRQVRLEFDATQSDQDRYGRLLRFVFLEDGTDVGKLLIERGLAQESLYSSVPHVYRADYLLAQENAQKSGLGFWAENACDSV